MPRKFGQPRRADTLSTIAYFVSGNYKAITCDSKQGYKTIDSQPGYVLWNENLTDSNDLCYKMGLEGLPPMAKAKKYLEKTASDAINYYGDIPGMNLVYKEIVFAKCWDNYLYYPIAWIECNCANKTFTIYLAVDMSHDHIQSKLIPHYHSMSCTNVAKPGADLYRYKNEKGIYRVTPYKGKYKGATAL